MPDEFISSNAHPLTIDGARYVRQLRQLANFGHQIESAEQAARKLTDRVESAASGLRWELSELKTLSGSQAEHVRVTLRAIENLLVAIAEKNLANSISRSVVENVYAEVTPLLESAIEESAARAAKAVDESTARTEETLTQIAHSIADSVGGKAPLPPPVDSNAPWFRKIRQQTARALAKTQRLCIVVAPPLVALAALSILVASFFYVGHFFIPSLR
jgi:hypothetical protein